MKTLHSLPYRRYKYYSTFAIKFLKYRTLLFVLPRIITFSYSKYKSTIFSENKSEHFSHESRAISFHIFYIIQEIIKLEIVLGNSIYPSSSKIFFRSDCILYFFYNKIAFSFYFDIFQ